MFNQSNTDSSIEEFKSIIHSNVNTSSTFYNIDLSKLGHSFKKNEHPFYQLKELSPTSSINSLEGVGLIVVIKNGYVQEYK